MIEVESLTKTFKVHTKEPGLKGSLKSLFKRNWVVKEAVKGASLKIHKGEIVGLIGSNGAGKTTLVKMLAGIIHPTSGSAKIMGHVPWERNNEFRRNISLIMGQKASLWWDLPAMDCFLLLKEIYQIPQNKFQESIEFFSETLQIKEQLKVQIRRLSLGERMKVELIAALLHNPKVVFLDEPTIGLDLTAQKAIREFILKYRQDHSPAMILTSHYMEDIERLCERIVILKNGQIIYDGALAKIYQQFAPQKVVTVHLANDLATPPSLEGFPKSLGTLTQDKGQELKAYVARDKVSEAASYLLKTYPVVDLNIEEQNISLIIEAIIREGLHQ